MRIFGDIRREAMRRKGSAAAIAPRKNLILPQDKSRNTRCLQFAASLVGRVNVRDLRKSQIDVKCFSRCRISPRMVRRAFGASRSHALQAIERASESPRLHARYLGHAAQALPSTRFSAMNDALRSRKTPPIATGLPQRAQFSPQEIACARVFSRCVLSTSINVGFVSIGFRNLYFAASGAASLM